MLSPTAPCKVIDAFLGEATSAALLEQILASEPHFTPSTVRGPGAPKHDPAFRSSLRLPGRVGVELDGFKTAIHTRFVELCAGAGMAEFPIYHTECSIVAHRDGDFYKTHIDTRTGDSGAQGKHVRMLSCVYYLSRRPALFTGGELALYPPGKAEPITVAPQHDRLAVFPAFIPHEVLPIFCPSATFADARFSINCWLHRSIT